MDDLSYSVVERPLGLRRRTDLMEIEQSRRGRREWVVKDPLAWRFFHFSDEEHALLAMLDDRPSLKDMQRLFEVRFAPQRLPISRLQTFLTELQRNGLLVAEQPGQGPLLAKRGRRKRSEARWQAWSNVLALRLRGVDPDRLLTALDPYAGWVFSRGAFAMWLAAVLGAIAVLVLQLDAIARRLPEFAAFFGGGNLPWLILTLIAVKTLHELGHATACKRFGGECHELGIQFLIFTPCLYCNVSDAWLLPNKWRRIVVSTAGMYVELFLAACATFLWWLSEPGLLNSLCLNVMFVCSLGTLLFNGNPLLRYDGYYILSDLIEVPNLEARSREALGRVLARVCLGVEAPDGASLRPQREGPLAAFAAVAALYRAVLLITIYLYLRQLFEPMGLAIGADGVFIAAAAGFVAPLVFGTARFVREARMRRQLHVARMLAAFAVGMVLLAAFVLIPLPHSVEAPLVLQAQGARHVYVTIPGTLHSTAQPGEYVAAGSPLAMLVNRSLERERIALESELNQQQLHVEQLLAQRGNHSAAGDSIPAAREALTDLEQRAVQLREHQARLTLRAPVAGVVIPPPPRRDRRGASDARELPTWEGTPLDRKNRGCYLAAGTLLCLVGDPQQLEAVAVLEQSQIEFVRIGQKARLVVDQLPQSALPGEVVEIAQVELEQLPAQLVASSRLASRTDLDGRPLPLQTSYQVRLKVGPCSGQILPGAVGRTRIYTSWQPLGTRLWRYLGRTFRHPS